MSLRLRLIPQDVLILKIPPQLENLTSIKNDWNKSNLTVDVRMIHEHD